MAEKFLDETWMKRLKVIKAVVPHVAKIFFLYVFVKMMRQSKVPIWKYPAAARAGRLAASQKILEMLEEAEKLEKAERPKNGGDSKLFSKMWAILKSGGTTSGKGEQKPGKDVPKQGGDEDKSGEDGPDD